MNKKAAKSPFLLINIWIVEFFKEKSRKVFYKLLFPWASFLETMQLVLAELKNKISSHAGAKHERFQWNG